MALTTLSVRWAPQAYWNTPATLDGASTAGVRWTPDCFWRSPIEVDTTAPSVTADVPAGTITPSTQIRVSCADTGGGFAIPPGVAHFVVWVRDPDGNEELVADVRSSADFDCSEEYAGALSVGDSGNGFFVDVLRDTPAVSGWPWSSFTLKAVAIDQSGNETKFTRAYTVSPSYETAPVRTFTPASLSTIAYDDSIQLDVTETAPDEVTNVLIIAGFVDRTEVVFDGAPGSGNAFDGYSVVESSPGGAKRWVFERDGGWPGNVSILVITTTKNPRQPTYPSVSSYTVTPASAPSIDFDPASGASFDYDTTDPVAVEVTDTVGVKTVRILIEAGDRTEVAFDGDPGDPAENGYTVDVSPISGGHRFEVLRTGGWSSDFTVRVIATNDLDLETTDSASYTLDTLPSPGDSVAPEVSNFSPASGTPIQKTGTIAFDVTDDSGFFSRIFVVAFFPATGVQEVVHDGDDFAPYYAHSSRVPISGGFHYTLTRTTGWPAAPTIRIFPLDASGNQV